MDGEEIQIEKEAESKTKELEEDEALKDDE